MSEPSIGASQKRPSLLNVKIRVVAQSDLAEIDERRRVATTAHPFNHAQWVQANAELIVSDVPALVYTVATEPDRIRVAVAKALRDAAERGNIWAARRAAEIENGADL